MEVSVDTRYVEYTKERYLKIHVAVNINSKEILANEITDQDEKVHDSKVMRNLVEDVLSNHDSNIYSLLGDGITITMRISNI